MATFYEEMRDVADELLGEFKQGSVQLKRVTTTEPDPSTPWIPGEETVETYELAATVKRVHQRYENGVLIVETGDIVTFAVAATLVTENSTPVEPPQAVHISATLTDMLVIDGAERVITNLTPIPPAGTVVAWKAWCAA